MRFFCKIIFTLYISFFLNGEEIYTSPDTDLLVPITIDISSQPKGIYFLKVLNVEKVFETKKIIVE